MKIRKAVIPAAGLGTRFLPATKAVPKEMLPILDKPTLQYIVEEAVESGIEEILIITGRNKRSIEDHFDKSYELETELEKKRKEEDLKSLQSISGMCNIYYIRQKEQRGLGDAVRYARIFSENEPFALLLGDNIIYNDGLPATKQLIDIYQNYNCSVLGIEEVSPELVNRYGIIKGKEIEDSLLDVEDLVEKPEIGKAPTNFAMLGRYVLSPKIFKILEDTKPGYGGEIQLTDALKVLAKEDRVLAKVYEGKTYDIGEKLGFTIAQVEFALRDKKIKDAFKNYLKGIDI